MSNKTQQYKSQDEDEIKSLIQKIQDFNIDENIKKMSLIKVHFVLSHIVHLSSIVRNRAKELSEDTYKKAYNLIDSSAFFFYNKIKDELCERWEWGIAHAVEVNIALWCKKNHDKQKALGFYIISPMYGKKNLFVKSTLILNLLSYKSNLYLLLAKKMI